MKPSAYIDRRPLRVRQQEHRRNCLVLALCCFGMAAGLVMISVGMNLLGVFS